MMFYPGMRPHVPRVRQDLDVGRRGSFRLAQAPRASPRQQPASAVGVSIPRCAVSTRGITVGIPGLSELWVRNVYDPGMSLNLVWGPPPS